MAFPDAAEFVRNWYTPTGDAVTGEQLNLLVNKMLPALSTQDAGVPQVKTPSIDPVSKSCEQQINALAKQNPSWAQAVGHHGLFKMMTACIAEQNGTAPVGFTQAVYAQLAPAWWKSPTNLIALVGVLGAGFWFWRRSQKKRR